MRERAYGSGCSCWPAGFPASQHDTAALCRALDAVEAAEAAGFDDAWIAEHHFISYGTCPSAITFAAHALGRTSRIRLGTAVSVLSTNHPVALAEQVALLDQLTDGRLRLGVGSGGPWVGLEVFGTGLDRYEHGFAESLDLLLGAWPVGVEGPIAKPWRLPRGGDRQRQRERSRVACGRQDAIGLWRPSGRP
jgi:alkanesulfonate monooxygenase SsuD/methylene tetrahydromethanopterin reductase-like flavin-dependent oxidoreductase (luciferase family)